MGGGRSLAQTQDFKNVFTRDVWLSISAANTGTHLPESGETHSS